MLPSLSRLQSCVVTTRAFSARSNTSTGATAPPTTLAIQLPRNHLTHKYRNEHNIYTVCFLNKARDLNPSNRCRSRSTQSCCASDSMHSSSADLEPPGSLHTATLKDGRTVTYSMCGSTAADAHTVLFLHPIQGNRYMALVLHAAAEALHLRVIAPDRPGVGGSSFLHNRTVQQYPADLAELCDQLGVEAFSVMASSAGTMYALACTIADETRHRIVGKPTIIAPWVPHSSRHGRDLFGTLVTWVPVQLIHAFVGFQNNLVYKQSLAKPVTDLMTRSTPTEVAAFANDPHYVANNNAYKLMISQWGPSQTGIVHDMQLCLERSQQQRLHFSYLKGIAAPVRVFAGTADTVMPYLQVESWAQQATHSNVELVTIEGGTHDGVMHTHKVKALEAIAADVAGRRGKGLSY